MCVYIYICVCVYKGGFKLVTKIRVIPYSFFFFFLISSRISTFAFTFRLHLNLEKSKGSENDLLEDKFIKIYEGISFPFSHCFHYIAEGT